MTPSSLELGQTYFRLTFADLECLMPNVRPMIYVGTNLLDGQDEDPPAYCFQDALSYLHCGSVASYFQPHPDIEPQIYSCRAEEIGSDILDLDAIIAALALAKQRTLQTP